MLLLAQIVGNTKMKISAAIKCLSETLAYAGKDEEVFVFFYTRDEAVEWIMNSQDDSHGMTEESIGEVFDDEQMEKVSKFLNQSEGVWEELNDSFAYIVSKLWKEKRDGKSKNHS